MPDRAERVVRPRRAATDRRLSRSAEFERVYRHGRSTANRHLVLYAFPSPSPGRPRLGLSVSRKVGGAVERNRIKRLLREAWARVEGELVAGHDVVLVARPPALELADREGLEGMVAALTELAGRARLWDAAQEGDAQDAAAQENDAGDTVGAEDAPSEDEQLEGDPSGGGA